MLLQDLAVVSERAAAAGETKVTLGAQAACLQ